MVVSEQSSRSYRILLPFLDECGAVYIPALGSDGSVVRLNRRATGIFRQLATDGRLSGRYASDEDAESLLQLLEDNGVICEEHDI
jgi:hypothetical protein